MNDRYSDKELKHIYGKRPKGTPLFAPQELGYRCPLGHANITWSEFNEHIWCYVCEKDFHYADDCVLIECQFNPKNLPQQPRIITGVINIFPNNGGSFNDIPPELLKKEKNDG